MKTVVEKKCAVIKTLRLISAKWKPCILCHLMDSDKRYGQLLQMIPNVSKKMLTQHLRELELDGLINRKTHPVVPPRVDYSLTEKGKSLRSVFQILESWGMTNLAGAKSIEEMIAY
ncbi:MAG: helix-turn-helix transcriptional regulator [Saprospiraceae bacterium]|nr:helix-turn-helix transcriptional regulator [Saprospiraceae bacterium]